MLPHPSGFTLLELLITIIIVGILSAIAIPSFLGQIARARSTEAKSIHGTILRAQQAYRVERGSFAGSLSDLDVKVSNSKNFSYGILENSPLHAIHTTTRDGDDLLDYASGIVLQNNGVFGTVLCEGDTPGNSRSGTGFAVVRYNSGTSTVHCQNGKKIE